MKTIHGTMEQSDLEGGVWVLVTEGGERYQLSGGDRELFVKGRKVTVTGKEENNMMGIGMMGPILKVKKYTIQ